ncbi:hypothetical protein [Anabaena sp. CS-542/02]|uniref:hypothetical protein n=1 Tax=Anabaena sp. CS-542/02 TaxID=3021719 RepID=UPI00232B21BF|nr:hypothetical protein [Anabaena sp. CS-542/02]
MNYLYELPHPMVDGVFYPMEKVRYSISHPREVQSCLVSGNREQRTGNREQGIDVYFISLKKALMASYKCH